MDAPIISMGRRSEIYYGRTEEQLCECIDSLARKEGHSRHQRVAVALRKGHLREDIAAAPAVVDEAADVALALGVDDEPRLGPVLGAGGAREVLDLQLELVPTSDRRRWKDT